MKVRDITKDRDLHTHCEYCGSGNKDLRPYGRDGAWICFKCGMEPENIATTETMFKANLDSADIFITGS